MREIKFRGWTDRQMRFGWGCLTNESSKSFVVIDENDYYPEPVQLMQFTGLKDMHGTEIYEDDIIQDGDTGLTSQVHYRDACFWSTDVNATPQDTMMLEEVAGECEVIGNIYENPELLK